MRDEYLDTFKKGKEEQVRQRRLEKRRRRTGRDEAINRSSVQTKRLCRL